MPTRKAPQKKQRMKWFFPKTRVKLKKGWQKVPVPAKIAGAAALSLPLMVMVQPLVVIGAATTGAIYGVKGMKKLSKKSRLYQKLFGVKSTRGKKYEKLERRSKITGGTAGGIIAGGAGYLVASALPWVAAGTALITIGVWGVRNRQAIVEVKQSGEWRAIYDIGKGSNARRKKLFTKLELYDTAATRKATAAKKT